MRQNFLGVVVGTAMQKTVKVRVMSQKVHPIVRKVPLGYKHNAAFTSVQIARRDPPMIPETTRIVLTLEEEFGETSQHPAYLFAQKADSIHLLNFLLTDIQIVQELPRSR